MQRAGAESWSLSVDDSELLHTALFVRDSCRLELPDSVSVPPPLGGDVPDRSADLEPQRRVMAGQQWISWWQEIVVYEGARSLGTLEKLDGPFGRVDSHVIVHEHLFDWPELTALSSWPELRKAVQLSHDDAVRWRRQRSRHLGMFDPWRRDLSQDPTSVIAQSVVERLHVSPGQVRAAVSILDVLGEWSATPFPGLLLCSPSVVADAQRLLPLLDAAFVSGVDAPEVPLPAREPKPRPMPASVIPEPVTLWEGQGASLTCERVIPYEDGFEIELRRQGLGPPPTPRSTFAHVVSKRAFSGLQVTVRYADGREERLDDLDRPDRVGPITVSAFGRRGSSDDTLWLWVMPLPPPGEVQLTVEWPVYDIEPVSISLDGATIRPQSKT
jgi:hypothetical protein